MAESPLQPDIRNVMIARMLQEGTSTAPVQHWTQGLARLAQALVGGLSEQQSQQQGRDAIGEDVRNWQGGPPAQGGQPSHPLGPITSGPRPANAAPATAPPRQNIGGMPIYSQGEVNPMDVGGAGYGNAVGSIESGGRYNLQGPVTRTGDRAYGKHQVMGANVPSFTQGATGTAATPQQFLANPKLQETTFNNKFAEYINRYGSPEAAARAWFAGEGGMNNPNARDQLGTTVGQYGQRFATAAGVPQAGQAPPVMAQGGPQQPQLMPQAKIPPQILQGLQSSNPVTQRAAYADFQKWKEQQLKDNPTYGVIRKDLYQNEVYGWRDPRSGALSETPSGGLGESGLLPGDHPRVQAIRKEVIDLPAYKNLAQASPIYKNMLKSAPNNSKASDLNLVYGLGKIFDPGSVVREGELILVKNTASLPDWLVGSINSLNGGAALTPETRAAIMREANNRMTAYQGDYDQATEVHRAVAADGRMNVKHVIPSFGPFEEYAPPTRPDRPPPQGRPQQPPAPRTAVPTLQELQAEIERRRQGR